MTEFDFMKWYIERFDLNQEDAILFITHMIQELGHPDETIIQMDNT